LSQDNLPENFRFSCRQNSQRGGRGSLLLHQDPGSVRWLGVHKTL
jgi:hypothetical protein